MNIARLALAGLILFTLVPALSHADDNAAATTQPAVSAVDYAKLKDLLPKTLVDQDRNNAEGQKVAMAQFQMTMAKGTYGPKDGDNPPSIELQIMDYGATQGMADAVAAWSKIDMDQESDSGYQKTAKIGTYPAMIQYQNADKHGTLQIFVADRFIVSVETHNLPDAQFQKIGPALPLDKLAALK